MALLFSFVFLILFKALFLIVVQALEVIQELQKHFPIKRCPLVIRVSAPEEEMHSLLDKLNGWNASITSREAPVGEQPSVVSSKFQCLQLLYRSVLHGLNPVFISAAMVFLTLSFGLVKFKDVIMPSGLNTLFSFI